MFLSELPEHEENQTHDGSCQIWNEVSKAAMALAGEPLCQLYVDSHCHHRARRNQNLNARAPAADLGACH